MVTPTGFSTVTPYFFVDDAAAFVSFLVLGLGGVEALRHHRSDGCIANAQVRLGSSTVMVSEASTDYPAMPGSFYLYVADADRALAQALAAGASLVMPLQDMSYGDRQAGVRDRHGNLWWISQRLVDEPYR